MRRDGDALVFTGALDRTAAAALWAQIARAGGPGARDAVWDHPDPLPTAQDLDDPAGQPLADVRRIRDDIKARVTGLLSDLQGRENGQKTRT